MEFDPYEVLGVSRSATDDEIKKAYRRLSKQYHPDLNRENPEAEKKFKEINKAYEVLGDKEKRAQYDQFGSAAFGAGGGFGGGGFPGAGGSPFEGFDFSGFSSAGAGFADIFESFFGDSVGGGRRRKRSFKGQDLEITLTIEFIDAIFGVDKTVTIHKEMGCEECGGKGIAKGSKIITCSECHGKGEITKLKQMFSMPIRTTTTCPKCDGEGQIPEAVCNVCRGKGSVRAADPITIRIPAGVDDGTTLRLSGKGGAGSRGNANGDLYVQVRVRPSSEFRRKGDDVYSEKPIHVLQAILGDEVEVNTVHGKTRLEIPAGTQPGQVFRIRGKGAPRLNASAIGDHYVTIRVEIPKKVSSEEHAHLQALAKIAKLKMIEGRTSFFSKLFFS